jgi:hypothetical protein
VIALLASGLDPSDCRDAITRAGQALAAKLATALDDEQAVGREIYICPLDNGSSAVLYFGYGKGHAVELVTVSLSGCRFISDPDRESRWWLRPGDALELRSDTGDGRAEPVAVEHPRRAAGELESAPPVESPDD